jgi:radical SAM superfamily enzyme YgiQ (UPF0313 family)
MAKKVALINPPWITKDETIWHGIKGAMPPLSLLSIGAILEENRIPVQIIDAHLFVMSEEEVANQLQESQADIIGITMMTSTAIVSHRIAQIAKNVSPQITVVVGGVHPDALPEETLRNKSIDLVVRGDGEITMLEICSGLEWKEIKGISYRLNSHIVHNQPRSIVDINDLPPYAYHLVPVGKYYPAAGAYQKLPAINMLMTRGCPGKCIFCNSAETVLRTRDARKVVDEIAYLRNTYGVREIQFYDDTFTVMKNNVFQFCELMEERKLGVTFSCFARTDCFSPKMAASLKKAGCHQVMFGVESGSRPILKTLRKDIDLEKTKQAVKWAKSAGLEVRAAFIFGSPGEDENTIQETLNYALDLDPDLAIFNITTPYPGTQFFSWAKKEQRLLTEDWWEYELGQTIVNLPTISNEKLIQEYQSAYRTFYNRPKIYWRRFIKIRSLRHLSDAIDAYLQIIFRRKVSGRGAYRQSWLKHRRADFFDVQV